MANLKARYIQIGSNLINIGYSEHDLTDELYNKLNGIESGAQVNIIEEISVNGEKVNATNKKVSITGLQKVLKAGTGIQIDADNTISVTIDHSIFRIVESLPSAPTAEEENKIFVVKSDHPESGNEYKEYIWIGKWEEFGDFHASVELADYLKSADAEVTYVKKESGKGLSANDFTDELKDKLDGISAGANKVTHSYNSETETLIITTE